MYVSVRLCAGFQKFKFLYLENNSINRVKILYTIKYAFFLSTFMQLLLRFYGNFNLFKKERFCSNLSEISVTEQNIYW